MEVGTRPGIGNIKKVHKVGEVLRLVVNSRSYRVAGEKKLELGDVVSSEN